VFNAPGAANGLGHNGWGYLIGGSTQYIYGATENFNSQTHIDRNHDIGYWDRQGTFNQMVNAFHDPSAPTLNRLGVGYYQSYKCISTTTSAVGAANTQRHKARCGGYDLIGNNSLDHVWRILNAYNGSIPMPTPSFVPIPNSWYRDLGAPAFRGWPGPTNLSRKDGSGSGTDPGGSCP
jgi:hypothetical protein